MLYCLRVSRKLLKGNCKHGALLKRTGNVADITSVKSKT